MNPVRPEPDPDEEEAAETETETETAPLSMSVLPPEQEPTKFERCFAWTETARVFLGKTSISIIWCFWLLAANAAQSCDDDDAEPSPRAIDADVYCCAGLFGVVWTAALGAAGLIAAQTCSGGLRTLTFVVVLSILNAYTLNKTPPHWFFFTVAGAVAHQCSKGRVRTAVSSAGQIAACVLTIATTIVPVKESGAVRGMFWGVIMVTTLDQLIETRNGGATATSSCSCWVLVVRFWLAKTIWGLAFGMALAQDGGSFWGWAEVLALATLTGAALVPSTPTP